MSFARFLEANKYHPHHYWSNAYRMMGMLGPIAVKVPFGPTLICAVSSKVFPVACLPDIRTKYVPGSRSGSRTIVEGSEPLMGSSPDARETTLGFLVLVERTFTVYSDSAATRSAP